MALDRVRNIFNSFLTFFSRASGNTTVGSVSERSPDCPRPASPPNLNTDITVDSDPVRQNFFTSGTPTGGPLAAVPLCDETALPASQSRASNKGSEDDSPIPQNSLTTEISTSDVPTVASGPSAFDSEMERTPVTIPGSVSDKLWRILKTASTKPSPRRREGMLAFTPPLLSDEDFGLRVLQKWVSLETMTVSTDSIMGYIMVANLSYAKRVAVRYTVNKWESYLDVEAVWIESVEGGRMDRFMFTLPALAVPGELSFAVRYNDQWDNNEGRDYTVLFGRI